MIDLKFLRENPDVVRTSQRTRGEDPALVDDLLAADVARRAAIQAADTLRSEQRSFGKTIRSATPEERPTLLVEAKTLADQVKSAESAQREAEARVTEVQRSISNIVEEGTPAGGEDDFVVLEHVGEVPTFDFPVKDHLELGENLRLIDMARGTKVSGSRFYFLTGYGALLEMALMQLALQKAMSHGFQLMITPSLVKPEVMQGTGFLGAHSDEIYHLDKDDDLYLVGTSEVPLAGYHSNEIIDLSDGSVRYAGYSACFRREAGSYGRDTRGIFRVHQFNKVEMFSLCKPEDARAEHQRLLTFEREMLDEMKIPYRIIDTAGGDLGSSAARKFDCEAWIPSQGRYRELTSTSNCTTYQARRLTIRYRDDNGRPQTAATLNGTLATMRWLVAIMENHQQEDGSIIVPEALRPWVGKDVLTA